MAFNLGRSRLGKFKKMIEAVNEGDYEKAAEEMIDSKWYHQVGNRSIELVEIMRG
jgi:lysozyme